MGHKKPRKAAPRDTGTVPRHDATTLTDPLDGTASIAPVTPDVIDHAAQAAADRMDAVAHGSVETAPVMPEIMDHAAEDAARPTEAVARGSVETVSDANEPADRTPVSRRDDSERPAVAAGREVLGPGSALGRYNAKALEIAAANLSAAGALVTALFGAKSLPEAAAINADHLRRHFDAMTAGGRDLMLLAHTLAFEAMGPLDDASRKR